MLRKLGWPITIIISSIVAGILAQSGPGGYLRPIVSFWFMLVCPGMAIVGLLHLKDHLIELVLSIALSISISVVLTEFMALSHLWSALAGLRILIAICLAGAALQIRSAFLKVDNLHVDIN